ncbi:MAG: hypothetical protein JKY89_08880 [Immundisolibacteraceae bacterium]|nr:hypothetical protein [Immundisolibacteraceae bacterium]
MSRALKALLFSAFVIPGAGHFYLKRFKSGVAFLVLTGLSLAIIISHSSRLASRVLEQVNTGEIRLDAAAISQALNAQLALESSVWVTMAWGLLIASFLVCLADAYRVGRNQQPEIDTQKAIKADNY